MKKILLSLGALFMSLCTFSQSGLPEKLKDVKVIYCSPEDHNVHALELNQQNGMLYANYLGTNVEKNTIQLKFKKKTSKAEIDKYFYDEIIEEKITGKYTLEHDREVDDIVLYYENPKGNKTKFYVGDELSDWLKKVKIIYCSSANNDAYPLEISQQNGVWYANYLGTNGKRNSLQLKFSRYDYFDEIVNGKVTGEYSFVDPSEDHCSLLFYTNANGEIFKYTTVVSYNKNMIYHNVEEAEKYFLDCYNQHVAFELGRSKKDTNFSYDSFAIFLHSFPSTLNYDFKLLNNSEYWKVATSNDFNMKFYSVPYSDIYYPQISVQYRANGIVYTLDHFEYPLLYDDDYDYDYYYEKEYECDAYLHVNDIKIYDIPSNGHKYYLVEFGIINGDDPEYGRYLSLMTIENNKLVQKDIIKGHTMIEVPFADRNIGEATHFLFDDQDYTVYVPILNNFYDMGINKTEFQNKYFIYKWNGKQFEYTGKKASK